MSRPIRLFALTGLVALSALLVIQVGSDTPAEPGADTLVHGAPAPTGNGAVTGPQVDRRRAEHLERELATAKQQHARQAAAQARRIAELEAQVASLARQRDMPGPGWAMDRYVADGDDASATPSGRRGEDRDAVLFALEEHLAMQPVDTAWERALELDLVELFADAPGLDGNALRYASCGSTFCRVEFEHADARAQSRLLAAVARHSAWSADYQDVFQYRPVDDDRRDDGTTSVFFVSRKGFSLPMSLD